MLSRLIYKLPIKSRMMTILMTISICSVVLCLGITTVYGVYSLNSETKRELSLNAQLLASRNAAALAFNNKEFSQKSLQILSEQENIVTGCILGRDALFASYGDKSFISHCNNVPKNWTGFYQEAETSDFNVITTVKNIYSEGEWVGGIVLISTQKKLYGYLYHQITSGLLIISLVIVLSLLLANFLQRFISQPIMDIISTTELISQQPMAQYNFNNVQSHELNRVLNAFSVVIKHVQERANLYEMQSKQLAMALTRTNESYGLLSKSLDSVDGATAAVSELIAVKPMGSDVENYEAYIQDIRQSLDEYRFRLDAVTAVSRIYEKSLTEEKKPVHVLESLEDYAKTMSLMEVSGKCELVIDFDKKDKSANVVHLLYERAWHKMNSIIFGLLPVLLDNNSKKMVFHVSHKKYEFYDKITFDIHPADEKKLSAQVTASSVGDLIEGLKNQQTADKLGGFFDDMSIEKNDCDFIIECARYIGNVNNITIEAIVEYPFCIISYTMPSCTKTSPLVSIDQDNVYDRSDS